MVVSLLYFFNLSLVIASKFRPLPVLEKLIDYMGPNRNFIVYSLVQEPLIECHTFLKRTKKAIHIELSDSWLREYQVIFYYKITVFSYVIFYFCKGSPGTNPSEK